MADKEKPPAKNEQPARPETGLRAFIRYYIWVPAPAADLERERQQKAERAARLAAEQQQTAALASSAGTAHAHTDEHHAPYMAVFGWLVVLTMIEVFPIFTEILFDWSPVPHNIWIPVLLVLAIIKATLVAMYYMHLKYDQPWLVWVLIGPLAFAMMFGLVIVAG